MDFSAVHALIVISFFNLDGLVINLQGRHFLEGGSPVPPRDDFPGFPLSRE